MKYKWLNKLNDVSGFSLVEAIVSVVIVGIAVIPISIIFTTSINQTVNTRVQMEANEIAQQTMEGFKQLSLLDVENEFLSGSTITLSGSAVPMGLSDIPSGYTVEVEYDTGVNVTDVALPSAPYPPSDVDATITVPGGVSITGATNDDIQVNHSSTDYPMTHSSNPSGDTRTLYIYANRIGNKTKIDYWLNYGTDTIAVATVSNIPIVHNAIRIDLGSLKKDLADAAQKAVDLDIVIKNTHMDPLSIYVYEDASSTGDTNTIIESGNVSVYRNMVLGDATHESNRIVELTVNVIQDSSGRVIASVDSTKINE